MLCPTELKEFKKHSIKLHFWNSSNIRFRFKFEKKTFTENVIKNKRLRIAKNQTFLSMYRANILINMHLKLNITSLKSVAYQSEDEMKKSASII